MGRCNRIPFSAYAAGYVVLIALGLHTILKDETIRCYCFIAQCACGFLFAACCLSTLSRTCVLRRKPTSINKPIHNLYDSDLEYESEEEDQEIRSEVRRHREISKKSKEFLEFCYSRPIYYIVSALGLFPLFVLAIIYSFELIGSANGFPAALLIVTLINAFGIVNVPKRLTPEIREPKLYYLPFDEFIEIPMKVVISKMFAALQFSGIAQVVLRLFYQLAAVYGMVALYDMPDEEIVRFQERSGMGKIYWYIFTIMAFANVCGVFLLLETFLLAFFITEERLLCTFERNWVRNLRALDYLLTDTPAEIESLEQLRVAYLEKCRDRLSGDENKAVQYIERPLWTRRRAFVDRPGGSPVRRCRSPADLFELPPEQQGAVAGPSNVPPPRPPKRRRKVPEQGTFDRSRLRKRN